MMNYEMETSNVSYEKIPPQSVGKDGSYGQVVPSQMQLVVNNFLYVDKTVSS